MTRRAQTFQHGIWVESVRLYRDKLPLILTIVAAFTAIDIIQQVKGDIAGSVASMVAWVILAISVHASVLNGNQSAFLDFRGTFSAYLWRSVTLAVPGFALAVIVAIVLGVSDDLAKLPMLIAYGLTTALVLGIAGTWLPAVVAESGNRSLSAAIGRGKRVFGYTLTRLIAGCGAIFAAAFGVIVIVMTLASEMGWTKATAGSIAPFELLVSAIAYSAMALAFVMLPLVLSRAYLIAEDMKKETSEIAARA